MDLDVDLEVKGRRTDQKAKHEVRAAAGNGVALHYLPTSSKSVYEYCIISETPVHNPDRQLRSA